MIKKAKRQNCVAYVVSIFLLAIIVLSLTFLMLDVGEKYIWQFISVISFVFLMQFSSRYLMQYYEYSLTPLDELHVSNQLAIVKISGKKRTLVCNVSLYSAEEAILISSRREYIQKYKKLISKEKIKKYDFCVDMLPERFCILKFRSEDEEFLLLLQCSDSFFEEMRTRI